MNVYFHFMYALERKEFLPIDFIMPFTTIFEINPAITTITATLYFPTILLMLLLNAAIAILYLYYDSTENK